MYKVAKGYSFVCKRGIITGGCEIKESDFASAGLFNAQLERGRIVEASEKKSKPASDGKMSTDGKMSGGGEAVKKDEAQKK